MKTNNDKRRGFLPSFPQISGHLPQVDGVGCHGSGVVAGRHPGLTSHLWLERVAETQETWRIRVQLLSHHGRGLSEVQSMESLHSHSNRLMPDACVRVAYSSCTCWERVKQKLSSLNTSTSFGSKTILSFLALVISGSFWLHCLSYNHWSMRSYLSEYPSDIE